MTIRRGYEVADILKVIVEAGGRLDRNREGITVEVPLTVTEDDYERICQTIRNHRSAFERLLGPEHLL